MRRTVIARDVSAADVVIHDPLPPGIDDFTWTCAASGGAACANVQGTGALNERIAVLPVGGVLTYTIAAAVAANANGSILNSVTVTPGSNTVCMPGATPGPCLASAPVDVLVGPNGGPAPTPALGPFSLLILALALVAFARRTIHLVAEASHSSASIMADCDGHLMELQAGHLEGRMAPVRESLAGLYEDLEWRMAHRGELPGVTKSSW